LQLLRSIETSPTYHRVVASRAAIVTLVSGARMILGDEPAAVGEGDV
jgi:hypothetical protein